MSSLRQATVDLLTWQEAGKIGTASDEEKVLNCSKILAREHPPVAHVVKTCNTRKTHVMIRVPAVTKTWGDAVRRESLGVCRGQSTAITRVLRVGITVNSVCLAAFHWQKDFFHVHITTWTWLTVLRQCFSSRTAADVHTPYKARPSQNWPKITTYDYVRQIFSSLVRNQMLCFCLS